MKKAQTIFVQDDSSQKEEVHIGYPAQRYPPISDPTLEAVSQRAAEEKQQESIKRGKIRFEGLLKGSNMMLFQTQSKKPLDFFPAKLTIDLNKVNLTLRNYFFVRRVQSINIRDIQEVQVVTTPLFATLRIVGRGYVETLGEGENVGDVVMPFLKKEDAKRARRIIEGLIIVKKENIDLGQVIDSTLSKKLEKIGEAQDVEHVGG